MPCGASWHGLREPNGERQQFQHLKREANNIFVQTPLSGDRADRLTQEGQDRLRQPKARSNNPADRRKPFVYVRETVKKRFPVRPVALSFPA